MNTFIKKIFVVLTILISCAVYKVLPAAAANQNVKDLFDDRISYDIYFNSGEDSTTVAHSVEIIRFEEIGGKSFLVVRSAGFNLKDEEGYILFDSVSAILPDRNFKIKNDKSVKFH